MRRPWAFERHLAAMRHDAQLALEERPAPIVVVAGQVIDARSRTPQPVQTVEDVEAALRNRPPEIEPELEQIADHEQPARPMQGLEEA
jgi:hypothetical protein